MDSFLTKRNKLKFIDKTNQDSERDSVRQEERNAQLESNVNLESSIQHFAKTIDDLSFDWENLETDLSLNTQWKVWEINWDIFDIRLLPYLDIKVLYRRQGGMIGDTLVLFPYIQKTFQIENIIGIVSDYYKRVTIKVSLYFNDTDINEVYQTMLSIFFINPREY